MTSIRDLADLGMGQPHGEVPGGFRKLPVERAGHQQDRRVDARQDVK